MSLAEKFALDWIRKARSGNGLEGDDLVMALVALDWLQTLKRGKKPTDRAIGKQLHLRVIEIGDLRNSDPYDEMSATLTRKVEMFMRPLVLEREEEELRAKFRDRVMAGVHKDSQSVPASGGEADGESKGGYADEALGALKDEPDRKDRERNPEDS